MSEIAERTLSWEEEEAALEAQVAEEAAAELAMLEALKTKQEALKTKQDALAKRKAEAEAKKQAELAEADAKKQADLNAVRQKAGEFIKQATDIAETIGEGIVYFVYPLNPTNGDIKGFCEGILNYVNSLYANLEQPLEAVVRPVEAVVRPLEAVVRPVEVLDHQETFASKAAASIPADEPVAPQAPKLPTNIGFTEVKPKSKSKNWDLTLEEIEAKRQQDARFRTLACKHHFNGLGKCTRAKECAFAHSDEQMPKTAAELAPEPEQAEEPDLTVAEIMERRKIKSNFRSTWCDNYYSKNGCSRGRACWFAHETLVNPDGSVYAE